MFLRPIRVVTGEEVRRLLPVSECIAVMERALAELAGGEVEMPVRLVLNTRGGNGALALMPAHLAGSGLLGYKAVSVYPKTDPRIEPTHQAAVAVLDETTGRMIGLIDGTAITEIRTAAVSAVATRHMARPDATVLTIIGAGAQAAAHVEAIGHVRSLTEIRIWSRDPARARSLAAASSAGRTDTNVRAVADAPAAVGGADIVVTATSSREPVIDRSWLSDGAHVNAVGACIPTARELDAATVASSRVVVDSRDAAWREAGDLILARDDGAITTEHIAAELGEVVVGRAEGRTSPDQITLFESLGLGVEDVAAAGHVLARAEELDVGVIVQL